MEQESVGDGNPIVICDLSPRYPQIMLTDSEESISEAPSGDYEETVSVHEHAVTS